jgi:hypothetical protein
MDRSENLGPMEPWQIRAFPRALRDKLTDEAHAGRITVGDLLTAIVLRHYASNNGADHASNNAIDEARQLAPLLEHMPAWLRAALFRRVAAQLGIEPPPRRVRLALANAAKGTPDARG